MNTIHHPELHRDVELDIWYIMWMEEPSEGTWARFRMEVPPLHGRLLRDADEQILIAYVKRRYKDGRRVSTDVAGNPVGRPRGGKGGTKDRSKEINAPKRSTRTPSSRHSVEPIRGSSNPHLERRTGRSGRSVQE